MMSPPTTPRNFKCPECKYDLRGLMVGDLVRCPECGKLHTRQSLTQVYSWRLRWRFALLCLIPAIALQLLATTFVPPALASLASETPLAWLASLGCVIVGSMLFINVGKCPPAERIKAVAYTFCSVVGFLVVDTVLAVVVSLAFVAMGLIQIQMGC